MHTKDKLANALEKVGLSGMAAKAAEGWYHDYLSPLDAPCVTLVGDLAVAASKEEGPVLRGQITALRSRVMQGDFDASTEESDDWSKSPEGQETFGKLLRRE